MVAKIYNRVQSTSEQKKALIELIQKGPPKYPPYVAARFIWPLDIAAAASDDSIFGYLMPLIDKAKYAEFGEVLARQKPQPSLATLCEIGYQTAQSYRALHLEGYCYRDISDGNLMFDPKTGDILICDNDNVGVDGSSESQVLGTWEYMAPEIILGKAKPSTKTDLHSLAVLLFRLWMWHHPMHGNLETAICCWDDHAKKKIYGEDPVFIYHPTDPRNRPQDPSYGTVRRRWEICPHSLKTMFIQAFTEGLKNPDRRIRETEWQRMFLQLKDTVMQCPSCQAEIIWDTTPGGLFCWHCRKPIPTPLRLRITHPAGSTDVLLIQQFKLYHRHLNPKTENHEKPDVLAELAQHPKNPQVWGLRNLTSQPWEATLPTGEVKTVAPRQSIPLIPNTIIRILDCETRIIH